MRAGSEPLIDVTPSEPVLRGTPEYRRAHYVVHKLRGKATACIFGCSGPLFEWANLTGDYNDPYDFAPMCRFCHRQYDYTQKSMEAGFTGHHGMRRVFKTTPDVAEDITNRYTSGDSMRAIARVLDVNYRTVNDTLKRAGARARSQRKARALTAEMVSRYESGDTTVAIARNVGVTPGTVNRALREAGVKLRNRSEAATLASPSKAVGDRIAEIISRYESGDAPISIARDIGISPGRIRRILRKAGVQLRGRSEVNRSEIATGRIAEITNRYESGDSTASIARDLDISPGTVNKALREAGIRVRGPGEAAITLVADAEMIGRYESGVSAIVIARSLGVKPDTVNSALRRAKIRVRSQSEAANLARRRRSPIPDCHG